jgi:hypothetical protein
MNENKTHYRRAFDSPYLSSADIVEPTILTIRCVKLEKDKTKKTQDQFNTAYFVEKCIRAGEDLKPMILNATNSRTMKSISGSAFIDDWNNIPVTIYVDSSVKFGRDTVEGLRISTEKPRLSKPPIAESGTEWERAVASYKANGNFDGIEKHRSLTDEQREAIKTQSEQGDADPNLPPS